MIPTRLRRTFNKPIRTAPRERKIYRDVVYGSIAEMKRAQELDILVMMQCEANGVNHWFRQVPFQLGPDTSWQCDFLVFGVDASCCESIWVEDVKQFETPASRRIVKLWKKYGPYDLHIIGLNGGPQVIPAAVRREDL